MSLARFTTGLAVTVAGAETAVSVENVNLIGLLAAGIGAVVMAMSWLERRQEKKITDHEATEFARQDIRDKLENERHDHIMSEIRHVKDLVEFKTEIRSLRQDLRAALPELEKAG